MKLCIIYNFAPHYRVGIFKKIDQTYDCDWFFGPKNSDIKSMDYSLLKNPVTVQKVKRWGPLDYQIGGLSLLFSDKYDKYLIFANTKTLSTWLFAILSKFRPKKKVYFWSHGLYGKESKFELFIKRILFKLPNGGTFVYGNYARNLMIEAGIDPNKVFTIHNSLDYDKQLSIRKDLTPSDIYQNHFQNNCHYLLFVGRLTPVKKLDQLLEALIICKKRGNHYNLTLIGGGEKEKELKSFVVESGLQGNVWFYGPCYDEKELGNLIYNADLCVSPGNIGLTAMHSMVFGTPALTHNCFKWQMPEFEAIKEGITGSFFEMDDIESLSHKIDEWFDKNGSKREQIRKECFKEIDEQWNPEFQITVIKKHIND